VAYASSSAQIDLDSLNNIFKNYSSIVIDGDFNAKHRSWNNFSNNSRGVQLYNYIQRNDILLIQQYVFA